MSVVVVIVVTISNSVDVYNSFDMSLWVHLTHNGCVSFIVGVLPIMGVSHSLWMWPIVGVSHSLWVCLIHCGCVSFNVGVSHLLWVCLIHCGCASLIVYASTSMGLSITHILLVAVSHGCA